MVLLNFEEPSMQSDSYGMSTVVRLQLEQNIGDMSFHRVLADMQAVRYYFVGAPLPDELQHFHFALRRGLAADFPSCVATACT